MTTATASVSWPTEATLTVAAKAYGEAFNQTERLTLDLHKILGPYMDEGVWPDPLPTTATVGTLYSFVETLRSEIKALSELADDVERDLRDIDALRLDAKASGRAS